MTDEKKYRTEVPNIIDDLGLDPHERALYVHYKRACGGNDCEWVESVRVTGKKTKMSFSKAGEARRGLVKRGLISLISKGNDGTAVRIANIWELNKVYYGQEPRPDIDGWTVDQLKEWCQGVHNTHTIMEEGKENGASEGAGVHNAHTSVHNTHNKKEPLNPTTTIPAHEEPVSEPPQDSIGILLKQFLVSSGLRMPRNQDKLDQWKTDLSDIFKIAGSNLETAKKLIEDTVKALGNKYTIVGPKSIYDSCGAEWAKIQRQEPVRVVANGYPQGNGPPRASPKSITDIDQERYKKLQEENKR